LGVIIFLEIIALKVTEGYSEFLTLGHIYFLIASIINVFLSVALLDCL
jgi:hypothetical protein